MGGRCRTVKLVWAAKKLDIDRRGGLSGPTKKNVSSGSRSSISNSGSCSGSVGVGDQVEAGWCGVVWLRTPTSLFFSRLRLCERFASRQHSSLPHTFQPHLLASIRSLFDSTLYKTIITKFAFRSDRIPINSAIFPPSSLSRLVVLPGVGRAGAAAFCAIATRLLSLLLRATSPFLSCAFLCRIAHR